MSTLRRDLRFAARTLGKRWIITSFAVLSLALAIGDNAASRQGSKSLREIKNQ